MVSQTDIAQHRCLLRPVVMHLQFQRKNRPPFLGLPAARHTHPQNRLNLRLSSSPCPHKRLNLRPSSSLSCQAQHQPGMSSTSKQYQDLDDALSEIGSGPPQLLLLTCVGLLWAGDAAEVMVLSYLGPAVSCNFGFNSPTSQSLLSSAVFAGMLLGAACWGFLADELGRKKALVAASSVVVAAGLASSVAPNPAVLLLSRACVGFGLAGAPVAFTLMMEMLPAPSRAMWGVLIELAWTVGTVSEAGLAWAVLNTQGWRLLLLLSAAPLALLLLLLRWLPESPRFLVSKGDAAGAARVLQQLAAGSGKPPLQLPLLTAAAAAAAAPQELRTTHSAPIGSRSSRGSRGRELDLGNAAADTAAEADALLPTTRTLSSSSTTNSQRPLKTQASRPTMYHRHDSLTSRHSSTTSQPDSQHPLQHLQQQHHQQQQPQHAHDRQQHLQHHQAHSNAAEGASTHRGWRSLQLPTSLQNLAADVPHALATLWGAPHASTTSLLLASWAAIACAYYGLVQLEGQLHIQAGSAAGAGAACINSQLQVPDSDYAAVMLAAAAEAPAVAWGLVVAKGLGGRNGMVLSCALACACLLPTIADALLHAPGAAAGTAGHWHGSAFTEFAMFGGRLFVSAAFSLLWVVTPAHFPTRVRGLGLGISIACSRLGALLSPFVAVSLAPAVSEAVLAGLCLAAAGAVLAIPQHHGHPTQEQQLEEEEEEPGPEDGASV